MNKTLSETLAHLAGQQSPVAMDSAFFQECADAFCQHFSGDVAFIGLVDETDAGRVNTIAVSHGGRAGENFSYALAGSPCEDVFREGSVLIRSGVAALYPDDKALQEKGFDSYFGHSFLDADGKPLGILVLVNRSPFDPPESADMVIDLFSRRIGTEVNRLKSEHALSISMNRAQTAELVLDSIQEMTFIVTCTNIINYANKAAADFYNKRQDWFIGRRFSDLMDCDKHRHSVEDDLDSAFKGLFRNVTWQVGGYRFDADLSPVYCNLADQNGAIVTIRNVTESVKLESRLLEEKQNRRLYEEILLEAIESMPGGVAIFDKDDRLIIYNDRYRDAYAKTTNLREGESFESILRNGIANNQYPQAGKTKEAQEAYIADRLAAHWAGATDMIQQTGDDTWQHVVERRTQSGYLIGYRLDVSALKNAEREVEHRARKAEEANTRLRLEGRQRKMLLRTFHECIDALPEGIMILDKEGKVFMANKRLKSHFPKAAHQCAMGDRPRDLIERAMLFGEYPDMPNKPLNKAIDEVMARFNTVREADEPMLLQTLSGWVQLREKATNSGYSVGVWADVSERIKQEQQTRLLAHVADHTANMVIITDAEKRIEWVNESFTRISGYTLADVKGMKPGAVLQGDQTDMSKEREITDSLNRKGSANGEMLNYRRDGTPYWVDLDIQAVRDDAGVITHFVAVSADITDRKKAMQEIENYAEELKRYAYVASHDLQEPLRKISTYAQLLSDAALEGDREEMDYSLGVLRKSVDRGRTLVSDLLRYSRLREQNLDLSWYQLGDMMAETCEALEMATHESKAVVNFDAHMVDIHCDQGLMGQVLYNLVGNAVKYRKPDVAPVIDVSFDGPSMDGYYALSVRDNGIGFDQSKAEQVFKPFQRLVTKARYQGSGIGLSLVKSILDKHGWKIEVESAVDEGTRFTVLIPSCMAREHSFEETLRLLA